MVSGRFEVLSSTKLSTDTFHLLNPEILDAKDTGIQGPRGLYCFNLEIFNGRCIKLVMTARRLGVRSSFNISSTLYKQK